MDGIGLAHFAHARWPGIGLVVISGKVGVLPKQLPEGARFMSKPYQEPQLLGAIASIHSAGARR
jgi:hypothetical protein